MRLFVNISMQIFEAILKYVQYSMVYSTYLCADFSFIRRTKKNKIFLFASASAYRISIVASSNSDIRLRSPTLSVSFALFAFYDFQEFSKKNDLYVASE